MTRLPRTRLFIGFVVLFAALVAAGLGAFVWLRQTGLPEPGTPRYEEYVESFDVGVAALDVDQTLLAQEKLDKAIQLVPQEAAAWANRGLLYLRLNQADKAAADLKQAHALAPDSGEIEALLGLLDQQQGRFADAAAHYRNALRTDPRDPAIKYALAQTVAQQGGPNSEADYQRLLLECLEIEPNSLPLLQRIAVSAANLGDRSTFDATLKRLRKLAPNWSPETQKQLADVEEAAGGPLPGQLTPDLNILGNLLMGERGYGRSQRALQPNPGFIGRPIYHFSRLQQPRASPAAPDTGLTFVEQPVGRVTSLGRSRWDGVWPVWLNGQNNPAIFVANGREVLRVDSEAAVQAFPGGTANVAPAAHGVLGLDWNNDLRTDLLLVGAGGLRFLQQDDKESFSDVTDRTGLAKEILGGDQWGAWAADIEMDGDLDVILAPGNGPVVVLRNNGDGTFKAIHPFPDVENVRGFAWADFDNDGAPDAAFLDAQGKLHIYSNERSGQFRRRAVPDNLGRLVAIVAADIADSGSLDLIALHDDGTILRLADKDNGHDWVVTELARWSDFPAKLDPGSASLWAADVDNNGALDLIIATSQIGMVWLRTGTGNFTALPTALPGSVRAVSNLSGEGRLDLLSISSGGQPLQLVGKPTRSYHWQVVRPRATSGEAVGDNRINSFGIGGEIESRAGTLVQKHLIAGPQVHFGLGEKAKADLVRILWPNGTFQVEFDKKADTVVQAEQRLKGSCPFLFTWDGTQVCFVTDFLWSTPLGMYINAQDNGSFLQTTEWVKIPGDKLVPRDGYYDVRVQANLWETHFYDYMALLVVDHPPGTEVFVDERFAMSPTTPQIYVTGPPHAFAHAWDDKGGDVTETVRAADGNYLDTFGRGRFQGVTRDHWVEVDLGDDAPTEGPVYLLARGWTHPTDSSINKALEKGSHAKPRALELEVPDNKGGWTVAQPPLGFPAGKDKTIIIRLDGITGPGVTRRFRLRTNMEIYWDALWYARGLDAKVAKLHWPTPTAADLRFRGIVDMTQANKSSPKCRITTASCAGHNTGAI